MIQRQNFKEQHILAPAYENTSLKQLKVIPVRKDSNQLMTFRIL